MAILTNSQVKKAYKRSINNKMKWYGDTDLKKKTIRVNKKMSKKNPMHKRKVNKHASKYPEVLDTIVHEVNHAKHPKMHEGNIRKKTKKLMKKLTRKQKSKYYKMFA